MENAVGIEPEGEDRCPESPGFFVGFTLIREDPAGTAAALVYFAIYIT